MKKSNKVLVGSLVVAVMGALTASSVMAYQGDYSKQGPNYSPERHATMTEAMANNDYETWKESMAGRGRVTQVINAENFSKFAEANKLAREGNLDEADQIRKELGLRMRDGKQVGAGYGKGQDRQDGNKGNGQGYGRMNNTDNE
ncbi:MAG: hypothetical protein U9Q72_01950 [Patescibacteria group bacterium]|nr:hypothetical protein [Patescibacteria group bacterium]